MMADVQNPYLVVGKIGSTYGIKGWIKILSYTEEIENILKYQPWYIEDQQGWKSIDIEQTKMHGNGIIVKFKGYDTPENARMLSGKKIAVLQDQLPALKKNEYYWNELQGLTVLDQHGENLGKVIYLMATGSNDVLVVKGSKEHAIPYIWHDVIQEIDLQKGIIYVDWEIL